MKEYKIKAELTYSSERSEFGINILKDKEKSGDIFDLVILKKLDENGSAVVTYKRIHDHLIKAASLDCAKLKIMEGIQHAPSVISYKFLDEDNNS